MSSTISSLSDVDWANWQPRDPATLVYIRVDDHVLLIRKKRGLGAGKINAPGGRLDPGETVLDCAIREVQEELVIKPTGLDCIGENLFQFVDGYSLHAHVFLADGFEGIPQETDEAVPLWYHVENLPYDEMWEDDRLWVPLLFERRRFRARYIFDDDRMLDHAIELL
ncbi:MAG: 8-oxo-dGTP diphosphatase [Bacteroidetes bacterium]|nr:8-oxo-dGTP diphosphatase [Bacteroidota bacterium]